MNKVDDRFWVLRHEPEDPLVPFLDAFTQSLEEQGFKKHLIGRQILVTAKFSQWLQTEGVTAQALTLTGIDPHILIQCDPSQHLPLFCILFLTHLQKTISQLLN
jgi:hypothetical protein